MITINMQYFGNKGASSGKSGKSGGGATAQAEETRDIFKAEFKHSNLSYKEINSIQELYKDRKTKVKALDEDGDTYFQKGYLGKDGTTFVNVKHIINDDYVLEIGTTTQGFVAEVRPGGKPMSKLQAWRMLKSYM